MAHYRQRIRLFIFAFFVFRTTAFYEYLCTVYIEGDTGYCVCPNVPYNLPYDSQEHTCIGDTTYGIYGYQGMYGMNKIAVARCPTGDYTEECGCIKGYMYTGEWGSETCVECAPTAYGSYCYGGGLWPPFPCPDGYFCTADNATICPVGSYCRDGQQFQCSASEFCGFLGLSYPGLQGTLGEPPCLVSDSIETEGSCVCRYGYYQKDISSAACTVCPAGSFCPFYTNRVIACNSSIAPAAYCPDGCTTATGSPCGDGYTCTLDTKTPCAQTGGIYCQDGVNITCPRGFYCPAGRLPVDPLPCRPGQYCGDEGTIDPECPAGYYCPDVLTKVACAPGEDCPPTMTTTSILPLQTTTTPKPTTYVEISVRVDGISTTVLIIVVSVSVCVFLTCCAVCCYRTYRRRSDTRHVLAVGESYNGTTDDFEVDDSQTLRLIF